MIRIKKHQCYRREILPQNVSLQLESCRERYVSIYRTGLGCSKLGLDNPGLVWNRISALEALKENSVEFFLSTIWWLDAPYRVEENDPKKAIEQRSIETQIKI